MRKKLSLLLVLALVSTMLFGCSSGISKNPTTITVWHYYNAEIKTQFDNLVLEFNETIGKKKGIIVDAYSQGGVNELADAVWEAANKDIGASEMPDIFSAYSDSAYRLDKLGVIATLDDYFSKDELEKYRAEFIDDGRFGVDGKLRIIPIAKSTELLFIDMIQFSSFSKDTGITTDSLQTWEGITVAAEKYYEWSGGQAMFGTDSMSNYMLIGTKQLGEEIFDTSDANNVAFGLSEKNAKKLWDCYYTPTVKGHYTSVGRFRSDDLRSDNLIMFTGSNSSASFFPKNIEIDKDNSRPTEPFVMPYPYFKEANKVSVQQGAGMVVAKSDTKTEKASVEFLKWMTSPEQNIEFAVSTSYLPVQNEALSYEKTLQAIGNPDTSDVRARTNVALYDMLDTYSLYASKPFDNSIEARNIINTSLSDFAKQDLEKLNLQIASGQDKEKLIQQYISDENFKKWYNDLSNKINALFSEI